MGTHPQHWNKEDNAFVPLYKNKNIKQDHESQGEQLSGLPIDWQTDHSKKTLKCLNISGTNWKRKKIMSTIENIQQSYWNYLN